MAMAKPRRAGFLVETGLVCRDVLTTSVAYAKVAPRLLGEEEGEAGGR